MVSGSTVKPRAKRRWLSDDLVRDIVAGLTPNSEWRMDVRNEAGEAQFCIRIVSEAIRQH
jgi:hypothetical protein